MSKRRQKRKPIIRQPEEKSNEPWHPTDPKGRLFDWDFTPRRRELKRILS